MLDALDDTWRRVGRIDLIAAGDLAVHALGPRMFEAFLLRRSDTQFLTTDEQTLHRLRQLRWQREGDLRYPVNELYCRNDTWQVAVRQLASESDAVLMDLRGFTLRNRGVVYELRELVRQVRLKRVVLLVDGTTDLPAIESTVMTAFAEVSALSPNDGDPNPQLNVLQWERSPRRQARTLFAALLDAAAPA
jgi:hypothetical protein